MTARDRAALEVAAALGVTVLGLSAVNLSDALATVLDGRSTLAYWLQTGLIAVYFALLFGLHVAGRRRAPRRWSRTLRTTVSRSRNWKP